MSIQITLNKIKAHDPCQDGWIKLLESKGKTTADDEEFPLSDVLDSNGLGDALWCLRCLPEHDNKWRLLAVKFAREVEHLMKDERSIKALDVAEKHARGEVSHDELEAARVAANAAARAANADDDAYSAAAWAAEATAWAADAYACAAFWAAWDARNAASAAACAAAWAPAWAAVGDAACDSAMAKQEQLFLQAIGGA